MKYLLAIAMIIMSASAAVAGDSSHCNSLDHGPSINKTELSERDMCWLDTHRDDESGVLGTLFYIKVDGVGYISMPIRELNIIGKDKTKEKIHQLIVQKIVEQDEQEQAEIRKELERELNLIRSEIAQMYGFVIINGVTESDVAYIQELVVTEIELTEYLYGKVE